MKKIANQILYNLKKEKSSFISFGVIILITALILNCAAVLLCQVDSAYDGKFEELSTATINAIVPEIQSNSELEKAINESIQEEKHLVLDIKEMEYISSAGLRVLLGAQKKMQKIGSMKVLNVCEEIMEIFEMTGFADILVIE